MGGNALQTGSVRLGAARYHAVESMLLGLLQQRFPARRIEAIIAYADKPDFGDLDLLVEGGEGYDAALMAAALGATEVVGNGAVTSIGVQLDEGVFQVDLIAIPAPSFDFAAGYFGYNDFGNLVGRIAHQFGAKFGHLGLLYPLRDPANHSHLIDAVCITADFATALALLGYDAPRYAAMRAARQFRTLDDMFRYVVSTPYASPAMYLLDQRSHKARIRDAKRATYNAFLTWLAQQPPGMVPAYPWGEEGTALREEQQAHFLHTALAQLPAFRERYDKALATAARARQLKRTFNGALVAGVTGLTGKELGLCMQRVRATFADTPAFEQFFLEASNDSKEALFLAAMDKT
ncbi:MAG: hypothetical protein WKG03_14245 [Telluria sp.]